ncbi:MAG: hypothetical protein JXK07_10415 [Spirochaetes bacterium]|nr:hypothetical protein [Spirochaetota bacterium]MBN2771118.1 hypothetical protein [Spirochaetota bacterium]
MENSDFRTSIDVELVSLERIEKYAKEHNMGISDVLNAVLDRYAKKLADKPKYNSRLLKYLERGTEYRSVHIRLSSISCKRLRDVCSQYCYSLSYMLSLAMRQFDEFMNGVFEFVRPSFHASFSTSFFGFPYFINYWGLPLFEDQFQHTGQETGRQLVLLE